MTLSTLLPQALSLGAALFAGTPEPAGGLLAIRVGRAETIAQGPIEHAVILVDGDEIVAVGEDLPIERGIPILDRPQWTVMPGLVNCYSRAGLDGEAGGGFTPTAHASKELYPRQDVYADLLELGVTSLGLYPPGTGVPGQAVLVRPMGSTREEMVVSDDVYLKIVLQSDASSKKTLRKGFEQVDEYEEKVEKERKKWEKAQEKKKKKKKSKKDDKDEEKDEEDKEKSDGKSASAREDKKGDDKKDGEKFVPPVPEENVEPFVRLRKGSLPALFRITKAGDYLHLLDVIEEEEDMVWHLRVPLRNDVDLYEVADRLGERELAVVLDPFTTFQPNSRRERNIPAELAAAGARVALIPRYDNVRGHSQWLTDVGLLIAAGMQRADALAAVTLEPARVLGVEERLGSIENGKLANLVFFDGDPFEPGSRVQAVMLEGELVFERKDR